MKYHSKNAAVLLCALSVHYSAQKAGAASVTAYAFAAAGQSSCASFGPTDQTRALVQVSSIEAYTPGPGCNVTESLQSFTAAAGPLAASSSASGGGINTNGTFTYTGSSQSAASFSSLGAASQGTLNGAIDGFSDGSSESFGQMIDGFTVAGAAGQSGYLQINYAVNGSQTFIGRGSTTMELLWQVNSGPQFEAFRAENGLGGPSVSINGSYVDSGDGISISPGLIAMSTDQSFLFPVFFNQDYSLDLALYGAADPGPSTGLAGPSDIENDFDDTVTLDGFVVYDSSGNPITGAQVMRDSAATPEPGTLLLLGGALAMAIALRSRGAGALAGFVVLLAAVPGRAGSITDYLNFAAVNQSQWASGPGTIIDKSITPSVSANINPGTFDINPTGAFLGALGDALGLPLDDLASVNIGPYGSITAGLNLSYHVNGGTLNLNYPTDIELNTPSQVKAGQAFTLSTNVAPDATNPMSKFSTPVSALAATGGSGYLALNSSLGFENEANFRTTAGFTTTFPYADAQASINLQASGGLGEQVCLLFVCPSNNTSFGSVNFSQQLVEVSTLDGIKVLGQPFVQFGKTYSADGFLDLTLNSPNVSVGGTLQADKSMAGSSSGPVLTAGFDVAQLIPVIGQALDADIGGLGYQLLKVEPQLTLGIYQDMTFQPNLQVTLQFNAPVLYNGQVTYQVTAPVGSALNITPAVVGGGALDLQVRPTYTLDNTFTNNTGLTLSGDVDVDALSLLDPVNIGPLFHDDIDLGEIDLPPLSSDSFDVDVGSITADTVDLGLTPDLAVTFGLAETGLTEPDGNPQDDLLIDGSVVGTGEHDLLPPPGYGLSDCFTIGASVCDSIFLADADIFYDGQDLGRLFCFHCSGSTGGFDELNPALSADFGDIYLSDLSTYDPVPDADAVRASDPVFGTDQYFQDISTTAAGFSTPEPGTMLLLGIALVALSLGSRLARR